MHPRPSPGTVATAMRTAPYALALALALGGVACKKQQQSPPARKGRVDTPAAPADPRLPAPHRLSAEPAAAAHLANPAATLAAAAAFSTEVPPFAELAEQVLATQGPADLAKAMAPHVDPDAAWTGAHVSGEDILQIPLKRASVGTVDALLRKYPKQGEFGAVALPRPALELRGGNIAPPAGNPPTRLAWVDTRAGTLTLAGTPAGLATGRLLAPQYGKRPLWFTVDDTRGPALLGKFPYARVTGTGDGVADVDITAAAKPGKELPGVKDLAPGAFPGMHTGPGIAVAASTRWTGYKEAVRELTHQLQTIVNNAGFAGKMMLDPIADQATRVLKSWNGRVFAGVGPARHVRVGLGADDPAAAGKGLLTLLRDITENLQLARMFVSNVPNAGLKKASDDIWLLTVSGIANQIPAAYRTILDDGRLRIAFASSPHAGGVLVVIGPRADAELKTWLAAAATGASGKDGTRDLAAFTLAAGAKSLDPLLGKSRLEDVLKEVLALSADQPPTQVVVRQSPTRYDISVRGGAPRKGR
jgi:hypothetical protein